MPVIAQVQLVPSRAGIVASVTMCSAPVEYRSEAEQRSQVVDSRKDRNVRAVARVEFGPRGSDRSSRRQHPTNATGHVSSYGIRWRSKGHELRASGSNPKFRMGRWMPA